MPSNISISITMAVTVKRVEIAMARASKQVFKSLCFSFTSATKFNVIGIDIMVVGSAVREIKLSSKPALCELLISF